MSKAKLQAKAIIFDLDGTIINTQDAYSEAAKTAFNAVLNREAPQIITFPGKLIIRDSV